METTYTQKAIAALNLIAEGNRAGVTRQMIDRLSNEKLIDFDNGPYFGWYVTEHGWNVLTQTNNRSAE
jgi:hypothetical protein